MGTKLEYAVNPLESSVNSNNFILHTVDDWEEFQNRGGLKQNKQKTQQFKFQESMDKLLEKHNFEKIKKTMQKHDAIFKQQVHELHQLYHVQKLLTDEVKKKFKNSKPSQCPNTSQAYSNYLNQRQQVAQSTFGYNFCVQNPRDDPSTKEPSASSCGDRVTKGFDLERRAEEDYSTGASAIAENQAGSSSLLMPKSSKMSTDGSDEDSDVDLTLSIGGSKGKKKSKCFHSLPSGQLRFFDPAQDGTRKPETFDSLKSDRGNEFRETTGTMSSSSSATFDQETKRPQWLFQGLSLNKT